MEYLLLDDKGETLQNSVVVPIATGVSLTAKGFAMTYYQEGYDAYDHTKGLMFVESCPYRIGTYSHEAWIRGYMACRRSCLARNLGIL